MTELPSVADVRVQLVALSKRRGATPERIGEVAPALLGLPVTSSALATLELGDNRELAAFEVLQCASQDRDRLGDDVRTVIRASLNLDGSNALLTSREDGIKGQGRIPSGDTAFSRLRSSSFDMLASYLVDIPEYRCGRDGRFESGVTDVGVNRAERVAENLEILKKLFGPQSFAEMEAAQPVNEILRRLMREIFDLLPGALGAMNAVYRQDDPFTQVGLMHLLDGPIHTIYGDWQEVALKLYRKMVFGYPNLMDDFFFVHPKWDDTYRDSLRLLGLVMVNVSDRNLWREIVDRDRPRYDPKFKLSETQMRRVLRDSEMFEELAE
jgi:hypothetical protein